MPDPVVGAREFLATIWGEREGVVELTYIDHGPISSYGFTYPDSLDSVMTSVGNHNGKTNCYFGVLLRKPGTRIGHYDGKLHRGKEVDAMTSTCVWMEADFKMAATPEPKVRELLAGFPLRPSIVLRSGGGVHVYWLLKEAAEGDDLRRVKAINRALVGVTGGDKQSVDLARILRVPDTENRKYNPSRPCSVSYWHPENRYDLSQFEDFLPVGAELEQAAPAPAAGLAATPTAELAPDIQSKVIELLRPLWIDGVRHRMALYVAGIFAHAGFSKETALAVVRAVSNAAEGDTDKRLKDVEDTYNNFALQKRVGGAGLLEKMVREEFPALLQGNAVKIYNEVLKHVRKASPKKGSGKEPDFSVVKIVKFDSRPAIYAVTVRHADGKEYTVNCEIETFHSFHIFRRAFFEGTPNKSLSQIKQERWEAMIDPDATPLEIREAPKEATVAGSIETALDDFLETKKETPDHGALRAFPGYSDKEIYFTLAAFKEFLKGRSLRVTDRELAHVLKNIGWEDTRRRIGGFNPRLWAKKLSGESASSTRGATEKNILEPNVF